jgi:hypothetical protein
VKRLLALISAPMILFCATLVAQPLFPQLALAQVEDAPAEDAAAGDVAAPEAAPAAAPGDLTPAQRRKAIETKLFEQGITDPAVLAIMESEPTTPAELLEAASILANLGQPGLAKPMLQQIVAANLDEAGLAELSHAVDSPRLLRLAQQEALQPEAATLVDAIFAAADKHHRDVDRLTALLPKLLDPSPAVHEATLLQFMPGREDSVKVLLHAMATAATPAERRAYTDAIVSLGPIAEGPLLGALESTNEALRVQVIVALGLLEVRGAALLIAVPAVQEPDSPVGQAAQSVLKILVGNVPPRDQVAKALERMVQHYLTGPSPLPLNLEGMAMLWHWDEKTQQIVMQEYPGDEVGLVLAAQLARELSHLEPENPKYRRVFLTTLLEAAQLRAGFDQPLPTGPGTAHDQALAAGPRVLQDVMEYALQQDHVGAAAAAAQLMGELGDHSLVNDGSTQPTPLVMAVRNPDRRVRFAALGAIMKLSEHSPFPGASYVTEALGFFAQSGGSPRVVIGHPRSTEGQSLVGALAALGFDADVASNGKQLIEQATKLPDVQFVIVHETIERPDAREVLYELGRNPNTGRLPVALLSTFDGLGAAQRMAAEFPRVYATVRPHSPGDLEKDVARLQKLAGRSLVTGPEMHAQAEQALIWIGELADQGNVPYEMQRLAPSVVRALFFNDLTATAAATLAKLPSAAGQQEMVNLASLRTTPIALRRELAKAFDENIARFGVQLTSDQIVAQYERYNLSVDADKDTQQVLGLLLDSLEKPTKKSDVEVESEK